MTTPDFSSSNWFFLQCGCVNLFSFYVISSTSTVPCKADNAAGGFPPESPFPGMPCLLFLLWVEIRYKVGEKSNHQLVGRMQWRTTPARSFVWWVWREFLFSDCYSSTGQPLGRWSQSVRRLGEHTFCLQCDDNSDMIIYEIVIAFGKPTLQQHVCKLFKRGGFFLLSAKEEIWNGSVAETFI